jgi:SnoaL-like protein
MSPVGDEDQQAFTDLRALWDIEHIKQLKARYWRYIDQREWTLFRDIFTPDCYFKYGPREDHFVIGTDAIVAFIRSWIDPGTTVHHGHAPEITITGRRTAKGIWALYDHVDAQAPRGRAKFEGYGHYYEEYEKGHDEKWRISSSRLTRLRVDQPTT